MTDRFVVGAVVPLTFLVVDEDGLPANAGTAALSILKPNLTTDTPTLTNPETGTYQVDYVPGAPGHYVATATFGGVNADTVVDNFDVYATDLSVVTVADAQVYLGTDTSWSTAEIQRALDAERAAQSRACDIDEYDADLREALLRRVARNLAARSVPLAQRTTFEAGSGTSTRVPRTDPEVARLEAPYRRWPVV